MESIIFLFLGTCSVVASIVVWNKTGNTVLTFVVTAFLGALAFVVPFPEVFFPWLQ